MKLHDLSADWRSAYRSAHFELGARPLETGALPKVYRDASEALCEARRAVSRELARAKKLAEKIPDLAERLETIELIQYRRERYDALRKTRVEPAGPARAPTGMRVFTFRLHLVPPNFEPGADVVCSEGEEVGAGALCVISAHERKTAIERFHALNMVLAFGHLVPKYHVIPSRFPWER